MTFDGKKIKAAAAHAGLTLTDLAVKMGISRATLYAYVAGQIRPSEERILEVASITTLPVAFFAADGQTQSDRLEQILRLVDAMLTASNPHGAAELIDSHLDEVPANRRGDVFLRLGNAQIMEGSYQEAVPSLMRAKSEFTRIGDRHGAGRCSQSLGFCYAHIGPLSTAHAHFVEAEPLLNDADRWKPKVALAVVAERRGNYEDALRVIDRTQKSFSDPAVKLFCRGVRGNILASLASWPEVAKEEKEALAIAEELEVGDQIAERMIAISLAGVYLDDPKTEFNIALCLGYLKSSGDKGRQALLTVVRSLFALSQGRTDEATDFAMSALTQAIKGRYRRAELGAYLRLAEAALTDEKFDEAAVNFRKAAAYAESYEYASERDYAEASAAFVDARRGKKDSACEHLKRLQSIKGRKNALTLLFSELAEKLIGGERWHESMHREVAPSEIEFVPGLGRVSVR